MSTSLSELAPISEAVTHQIRVEVMSRHSPQHLQPGQWIFEYTVRLTNLGHETVQLLNRHWTITDALERVKEVKGPGVVGKQPVLAPGESFQYSSWCSLPTPTGTMRGAYQMAGASGSHFDVEIAPFALKAPYTVH